MTQRRKPATSCRIDARICELGASLRAHRRKQGLSATALALLAGISVRTLEGLERGERPSDLGTVFRVLEALRLRLWAIERARVPDGVVKMRRPAKEPTP